MRLLSGTGRITPSRNQTFGPRSLYATVSRSQSPVISDVPAIAVIVRTRNTTRPGGRTSLLFALGIEVRSRAARQSGRSASSTAATRLTTIVVRVKEIWPIRKSPRENNPNPPSRAIPARSAPFELRGSADVIQAPHPAAATLSANRPNTALIAGHHMG